MTGPYSTRGEAAADAAHIYQAARWSAERGLAARIQAGLILAELKLARVEVGAYDELIVGWLSTWEPELVQVVIGWIERAATTPRRLGCPCGCPAAGPCACAPNCSHCDVILDSEEPG